MAEEAKTVNQEQPTAGQPERTFTQAEMDAIIGERLSRERAKFADYEDIKAKAAKYDEVEEASKSELQKVTEKAEALQAKLDQLTKADEVRKIREAVSSETGVPANLLSGDDEQACKDQAAAILAFVKNGRAYPSVKDAGEAKPATMTKEQILSIKDQRARVKAIEENIALFEKK
jgi:hypothetical protein